MFPLNPKHMPKSVASLISDYASSLISAYASITALGMLFRAVVKELKDLIPQWVRSYIYLKLRNYFFKPPPNDHPTLVIKQTSGIVLNEVYEKVDVYLGSKISPSDTRLELSKTYRQKTISLAIEKRGQVVKDTFDDIEFQWRYIAKSNKSSKTNNSPAADDEEVKHHCGLELTFNKKHKSKVMDSYMPYVFAQANSIRQWEKVLKLYCSANYSSSRSSIDLVHPATFDTVAMEPELKKMIIDDLDRFLERRELYKKVGKAWKRGYLLYGPPGTGKSSLIAAIANYLKFDIYDLELSSIFSNSDLRRVLLSTTNRSIVVIEDIDCSVKINNRETAMFSSKTATPGYPAGKFTLSGLLNFIDGLWSCCGDERIIIFTTNYKDKLDPALLRAGRMDVHIHLSYCTPNGFRTLASNYLGIHESNPHHNCGEIESLIESTEVTPAALAEALMKSDDADVVLEGLVKFLKEKKAADDKLKKAKKADEERTKAAEEQGTNKAERQERDEDVSTNCEKNWQKTEATF